jgi:hypothetical protein
MLQMGLFSKTNLLVFCAYLICIEKINNFVEENFSIQPFFLRKLNLKIKSNQISAEKQAQFFEETNPMGCT